MERLETEKNVRAPFCNWKKEWKVGALQRQIDDLAYKVKRLEERAAERRVEEEGLRERLAESERAAAENAELRRLLEHNAADENANNIFVELQEALNRITALGNENEGLRRAVDELEARVADAAPSVGTPAAASTPDSTPVQGSECGSAGEEDRRLAALQDSLSALEGRFTKAMAQNADLSDQNSQLEHLITQLQVYPSSLPYGTGCGGREDVG